MSSVYRKNIFRTIGKSKGRFFAIMAIIVLGVGFFVGLKVTKPAMVVTGNTYMREHKMYDFRLLSTYGFTEDEVLAMDGAEGVISAEGSFSRDFIYISSDGAEAVLKAITVPEKINTLNLRAGRMPDAANECVLDAYHYSEDMIGKELTIDISNSDDTKNSFKYASYKVVGLADTPLYLNMERGTTSLGSGRLSGFVYIPSDGFEYEYYTEMYLQCQDSYDIYTEEYDDYIDSVSSGIEDKLKAVADVRYKDLANEITEEYNAAVDEIYTQVTEQVKQEMYSQLIATGLTEEMIDAMFDSGELSLPQETIDEAAEEIIADIELPELEKPEVYVLDRSANTGYVCYDNDTDIVNGVARVFPVFFFLIAALVCSTTMTRMVDDERGQIGTFRALGYSNGAIMAKYLIYSGIAALSGCLIGYFAGTVIFPMAIWNAYHLLYGFGEGLEYYFSPSMLIISIAVSLVCSMGTAFLACRNELRCMPADLIRPKAPAAGKRILLEKVGFLWKRMKFLHKVTARNVFRFKKRMLMMIVGIAGCTALVLTGLGIRDSVSNIASFQYDEIEIHDMEATFKDGITEKDASDISGLLGDDLDGMAELYKTSVEYHTENAVKTVYLVAANQEDMDGYMDFRLISGGQAYPEQGQVMITEKLAEIADVSAGDTITFSDGSGKNITLEISGVFENYVWHYAYVTPDTYEKYFGGSYEPNTMYINLKGAADNYESGAKLGDMESVMNVLVVEELKDRISDTMKLLDTVVWLVIGSAGALAFIVLFNLSNINITERVREIATIKVLGFYPRETGAYVFRENLVLTIMGIIVGLPLGVWLHSFVISQIQVDMVAFKTVIMPVSYVISVITVLLFLKAVDIVMRRKIEIIDMAESLKSIE